MFYNDPRSFYMCIGCFGTCRIGFAEVSNSDGYSSTSSYALSDRKLSEKILIYEILN